MNKRDHQSPRAKPARPPLRSAAPTRTDWAPVADWYDALVGDAGSEYHREVIIPGILRMLDLRRPRAGQPQNAGLTILDMACGQGVLCRKLAATGCAVTGIDAAEPLIAAAKKRNETDKLSIRYLVADATKLLDAAANLSPEYSSALPTAAFDAITLVLAIQNISPLSPVWRACHALLKPGGKLAMVMMHPCFRIPKSSDWHWEKNAEGGTQARLIRQYLSSESIPIQTHPGLAAHGKDDAATVHFHRPLQAYINTLAGAGLLIDHLEEWPSHKTSEAGPRKAALDRARKEIPLFLALRAKKV